MQAKAQLVGIRDRVSNDASNASSTEPRGSAKRVITATNPNAEDAADLLRYHFKILCEYKFDVL